MKRSIKVAILHRVRFGAGAVNLIAMMALLLAMIGAAAPALAESNVTGTPVTVAPAVAACCNVTAWGFRVFVVWMASQVENAVVPTYTPPKPPMGLMQNVPAPWSP